MLDTLDAAELELSAQETFINAIRVVSVFKSERYKAAGIEHETLLGLKQEYETTGQEWTAQLEGRLQWAQNVIQSNEQFLEAYHAAKERPSKIADEMEKKFMELAPKLGEDDETQK